jgi:hypothetical protein
MSLERALAWWSRHADPRKGDKLNLMCGPTRLDGYVNADWIIAPGVETTYIDPIHPVFPWRDNRFEFILWNQGPEHLLDVNATIQELYRISVDGAEWYLETVGWRDPNAYGDPTHFSHWGSAILNFYRPEGQGGKRYEPARFTFEFAGSDEGSLEWKCIVEKTGGVSP